MRPQPDRPAAEPRRHGGADRRCDRGVRTDRRTAAPDGARSSAPAATSSPSTCPRPALATCSPIPTAAAPRCSPPGRGRAWRGRPARARRPWRRRTSSHGTSSGSAAATTRFAHRLVVDGTLASAVAGVRSDGSVPGPGIRRFGCDARRGFSSARWPGRRSDPRARCRRRRCRSARRRWRCRRRHAAATQ